MRGGHKDDDDQSQLQLQLPLLPRKAEGSDASTEQAAISLPEQPHSELSAMAMAMMMRMMYVRR